MAFIRASSIMFASINPARKLRLERVEDFQTPAGMESAAVSATNGIATILKAIGSSIDEDLPRTPMPEQNSDWPALIERIRSTASRMRESEAQTRERAMQVEDLLSRARADIRLAEERVRAAEAKAAEAEAAANERVRAAEERATQAEERANTAEAWLRQIHETIFSEFSIIDEANG